MYEMNNPYPLLEWGQSREVTGLTLGAGLEWRFAAPVLGPVTLRGEYLYDEFPSQTFALSGGPIARALRSNSSASG